MSSQIKFVQQGPGDSGSTSVSPEFNSAIQDGSMLLLVISNKLTTATPETPSNWNLLRTHTGGTGTDGANTGPTRTTIFWKIKDGNNDGYPGSVTVSIPGGNSARARLYEFGYNTGFEGAIQFGAPVHTASADSSHDTSVSFTGVSAGVVTWGIEDIAIFFGSLTSTSSTSHSAASFTITGATISIVDYGWSYTTTGNNILQWFTYGNITSGTATGAPTYSHTHGTNESGSGIFVKLPFSLSSGGAESEDSETGTFSESESLGRDDPSDTELGTFTELEQLTYINTDRTLFDDEGVNIEESDGITTRNITDSDSFSYTEHQVAFLSSADIVFNNDQNNPGFRIELHGLLDGAVSFEELSMFRRDPLGRYPDERVRGLDMYQIAGDSVVTYDYEAPLGVVLEYYVELIEVGGGNVYVAGPLSPTPLPYIPTQSNAFGNGVAYIKNIENPALSRAVMVEEFRDWQRSPSVLAEHHILGRRNPIVITDVMGGRSGSFTVHAMMPNGQELDELDSLFNNGGTLLFQNNNYIVSGFKDMFFKVNGNPTYSRRHMMVGYNALQTPLQKDIIITVEIPFIEVDRPATVGVVVTPRTWQNVRDLYTDWQAVKDDHADWDEVHDPSA